MSNRPDFLSGGEPTRLIPIVADSAKEQKSTSVLPAGMRSVFELRQALLKSIGIKVGVKLCLKDGPKLYSTRHRPKSKSPKIVRIAC